MTRNKWHRIEAKDRERDRGTERRTDRRRRKRRRRRRRKSRRRRRKKKKKELDFSLKSNNPNLKAGESSKFKGKVIVLSFQVFSW